MLLETDALHPSGQFPAKIPRLAVVFGLAFGADFSQRQAHGLERPDVVRSAS